MTFLQSLQYAVKDHISNTKLEKGAHYYIQTASKYIDFKIVTVFLEMDVE